MTPSFKTAADFAASTAGDFAKADGPALQGRCRVAGCGKELGAHGIVCSDHYFQLDRADLKMITRLQLTLRRSTDPEERTHLREQIDGYIGAAVRRIEARKAASA